MKLHTQDKYRRSLELAIHKAHSESIQLSHVDFTVTEAAGLIREWSNTRDLDRWINFYMPDTVLTNKGLRPATQPQHRIGTLSDNYTEVVQEDPTKFLNRWANGKTKLAYQFRERNIYLKVVADPKPKPNTDKFRRLLKKVR